MKFITALLVLLVGCAKPVQHSVRPGFIGMLSGVDKLIVGPRTDGHDGVQIYDHGTPSTKCLSFEHKQDSVPFTGFLNADGTVTPSPEWLAHYCKPTA